MDEHKMVNKIVDANEREAALDPEKSFIVQAPAGSGKTELLTQRYLKLLSRVEEPEQIIAITFTRKAAAEMRGRIMQALSAAKCPDPPQAPHARRTWMLARDALLRNEQKEWNLSENPSRLRVQTIDSLCAGLVRQMPFLSRMGASPAITEQADDLYREAAGNTVADLESGARWSPSIESLIRHLDNHLDRVEELIAGMLARRDQWLRHVAAADDEVRQREMLEKNLEEIIEEHLNDVCCRFQEQQWENVIDLACFAAENLIETEPDSPLCTCRGIKAMPGETADQVPRWRGLCDLLLTQKGEWRKTATKKNGFPAPSGVKGNAAKKALYQEKKEAFKDLLESLSVDAELAGLLQGVRGLPPDRYEDDQWQIMRALFEILTVAVGHLQLVFAQAGQVDFAEVALRAGAALGPPDQPTDLTLSMDYRLWHILIDEFQDTSFTQFKLLEQLTAGWEPGDGRTFFAVGDPMQSIYAFREAEVGLFLKARKQGLENIDLHPLTLSVNFRSQQQIVEWVNACFPVIMPAVENITTGAVSYAKAAAFHPEGVGASVAVHPLVPADKEGEAKLVVQCIHQARRRDPDGTIAILVRSRPHLERIVPKLKEAGLKFRAVEIESLKDRVVIRDLVSLARALSHPADRIAWLAVLRAPWCGLLLSDMYKLVDGAPGRTVYEIARDPARLAELSQDGRERLTRVMSVLAPIMGNRSKRSFRRQVEGAWLALGGPACVFSISDLTDTRAFFDLLDQQADPWIDAAALESALSKLYAVFDAESEENLQVMTIHKAKGLEFDTVILPGLERKPHGSEKQLLLWLERSVNEESRLLLAPISGAGGQQNPIYDFISALHSKKRAFEDTRLLYVAVTRARKQLHVIGGAAPAEEPGRVKSPDSKSLLHALWPAVEDSFTRAAAQEGKCASPASKDTRGQITIPHIRRLNRTWKMPAPPPDAEKSPEYRHHPEIKVPDAMPVFDWAGEAARLVGIVIHDWLRIICEQGIERWPVERIKNMRHFFEQDLVRAGMVPDPPPGAPPENKSPIGEAANQVMSALINMLADERGTWILSKHEKSACEFALTGRIDDEVISVVMDRTFVDPDGTRWIIDYKTGTHEGGSTAEFLDREQERYLPQMQKYARLMAASEDRPIRLGLYYPRLAGWREWEYEALKAGG